MKAKFIYESIDKVFKPKSEEEINTYINNMGPDKLLSLGSKKNISNFIIKAVLKGADIHANFDQALRWAVFYDNYDIVKFLLDKGADPNVGNGDPMIWAINNNSLKIAKLLLNNGAIIKLIHLHNKNLTKEMKNLLIKYYESKNNKIK